MIGNILKSNQHICVIFDTLHGKDPSSETHHQTSTRCHLRLEVGHAVCWDQPDLITHKLHGCHLERVGLTKHVQCAKNSLLMMLCTR